MQQTKDDAPQEALLVWFLKIWAAIEKDYPKILAGFGVGILAVLIFIFINHYQNKNSEAANQAMGEVYISLFKGDVNQAISLSQKVLNEYGNQPIAQEALLAIANLQFEQKQIAEAQGNYQKYLDQYGSEGPLGYGAWAGLAACLEMNGKFLDAAQKFASYSEKHPQTPFAPVALKESARCFDLANASDQANASYQKILVQYQKSPVAGLARNELSMKGITVE